MSDTLAITGSSMSSLAEEYRTVANNLANVSTPGFKKSVNQFHHILNNMTGQSPAGAGADQGEYPKINSRMHLDFTQGSLENTNRPLDVAIEGEGFFVLETPAGPMYTRNGTFRLDATGQLVDGLGRTVAGTSGPIVVPDDASEIHIGRDGTVTAGGDNIGQIEVVKFENPNELTPVGHCAFRVARDIRPQPDKEAVLHQGYREGSNVEAVRELVNLIRISRLYEANVKSVKEHDQRFKELLNVAKG